MKVKRLRTRPTIDTYLETALLHIRINPTTKPIQSVPELALMFACVNSALLAGDFPINLSQSSLNNSNSAEYRFIGSLLFVDTLLCLL